MGEKREKQNSITASGIVIEPYLNYHESEIIALYQSAGWINYCEKPKMLEEAYLHSLCSFGAFKGEELVGIIRVVGDGASVIYIQDIVVFPAYQRIGIGSMLVKSVLHQYSTVYQKVLMTDNRPENIRFYKSLGFDTADRFSCVGLIAFSL